MNESAYNSKQKLNPDKCRSECNESYDWGSCEMSYMWNHSTCDSECNNTCETDEYLDTNNCSCEKRLIGKLVLESKDVKYN